ncbi:MAG: putative sugar O-methyltransferase [Gammaproteobacteria bacterium]|nr:putative sugar O-methyltransferase [Gammaproteobacteria bacterium]
MTVRHSIKQFCNFILRAYGHEIVESNLLYDWQKSLQILPRYIDSPFPEGAASYLRRDHPWLMSLQERYTVFTSSIMAPLEWTDDQLTHDDIKYFRGDNAYVWQLRGQNMSAINYALTTYYVKSIDKRLLEKLVEDGLFGVFTFSIDDKIVSRDLLDSIIEINFLEKHLNLSSWNNPNILDIGAGYGRLAHRMISALPNINTYLCTDAVAYSTFISEYYLRFRNIDKKARVIPLDEIETVLQNHAIDIAVNIHSFSECRIPSIEWWVSLLAKNRVRYLMIVPNAGNHGGKLLLTNDGHDIQKVVEGHGYKLVAKEPKYRAPILQEYGLNPTYHYLFEISDR